VAATAPTVGVDEDGGAQGGEVHCTLHQAPAPLTGGKV
jgi:hypothetical protein